MHNATNPEPAPRFSTLYMPIMDNVTNPEREWGFVTNSMPRCRSDPQPALTTCQVPPKLLIPWPLVKPIFVSPE
jgi:hypothetical protein